MPLSLLTCNSTLSSLIQIQKVSVGNNNLAHHHNMRAQKLPVSKWMEVAILVHYSGPVACCICRLCKPASISTGVGSGFCVEYCNGLAVNLVTLYTSNKAERQMAVAKRSNRLVKEHALAGLQLTNAVSELCRQADAFLLVVDASCGPSELCFADAGSVKLA